MCLRVYSCSPRKLQVLSLKYRLQSKSVHFLLLFFYRSLSALSKMHSQLPTYAPNTPPAPPERGRLLSRLRNSQIGFQCKYFQEWVSELAVWNLYVFLVKTSCCHLCLFFEKETFLLKGRWWYWLFCTKNGEGSIQKQVLSGQCVKLGR